MNEDPLALLPELLLLVGAVSGLLLGSFLPQRRQWAVRLLAAAAVLGALAASVVAFAGPDRLVFDDTWAVDTGTGAARVVVLASTLVVLGLGVADTGGTRREAEACVLSLLAATGALAMAAAADLLVLAVAYLLASIPLYALVGIRRDPLGTEAALKTYLLGAFLGVTMLLGVVLLFAAAGATGYGALRGGLADAPPAVVALGVVGLLAGLLFKVGAVPAHPWVPDAAEASVPSVAAFVTTVPKVGGLVAAFRVLDVVPEAAVDWPLLVAVLAAASMTLGNLAAFAQTSARRLLGWSTVSQAGYLLMGVAAAGRAELALPSLLFYAGAYAVTNLTAFGVVAASPGAERLSDWRGLGRRRPVLAAALVVSLLGLVGTPPTAVFVGKLTVFAAAWDAGLAWLVVVAAVNTVASLFYYLRWFAPALLPGVPDAGAADGGERDGADEAAAPSHPSAAPWATGTTVVAAAASLVGGVAAGLALPVLDASLL